MKTFAKTVDYSQATLFTEAKAVEIARTSNASDPDWTYEAVEILDPNYAVSVTNEHGRFVGYL